MTALQVHFEGKVQGVGFRWSVRDLAQGFEVAGTVRNLPDGRVELCVQGGDEEVAGFLKSIRESHLAGHIEREEAAPWSPPPGLRGFRISP